MARVRGREIAAFFLLSALWSGNWLVIKIGLASLPPLRFAGLRMAIACLLLAPLALGRRRRQAVTAIEIRWIALIGLLQIGVSYACVFTAEQWIDSGMAALLFATFPIWVGVLGHVLLPDEPLTRRTASAILLGVAGVAVIEGPAVSRAAAAGAAPLAAGGALMIVSAAVSAYSAVMIKKRLSRVRPEVNVWGQALVSSLFLLGAAGIFERGAPSRWTPASAGALAYLAVVGTFTFVGTQWLVPRVPVAVTGAFPLVNTVLALLWGSALAGERLPPRALAGAALILAGVLLVTLLQREPAGASPASPEAA